MMWKCIITNKLHVMQNLQMVRNSPEGFLSSFTPLSSHCLCIMATLCVTKSWNLVRCILSFSVEKLQQGTTLCRAIKLDYLCIMKIFKKVTKNCKIRFKTYYCNNVAMLEGSIKLSKDVKPCNRIIMVIVHLYFDKR